MYLAILRHADINRLLVISALFVEGQHVVDSHPFVKNEGNPLPLEPHGKDSDLKYDSNPCVDNGGNSVPPEQLGQEFGQEFESIPFSDNGEYPMSSEHLAKEFELTSDSSLYGDKGGNSFHKFLRKILGLVSGSNRFVYKSGKSLPFFQNEGSPSPPETQGKYSGLESISNPFVDNEEYTSPPERFSQEFRLDKSKKSSIYSHDHEKKTDGYDHGNNSSHLTIELLLNDCTNASASPYFNRPLSNKIDVTVSARDKQFDIPSSANDAEHNAGVEIHDHEKRSGTMDDAKSYFPVSIVSCFI